jgi:hypothetical protein
LNRHRPITGKRHGRGDAESDDQGNRSHGGVSV